MTAWDIAAISTELVTIDQVLVDGEPVTDYTVALARYNKTPTLADFFTPTDVGGVKAILIGPGGLVLPIGTWRVWVRHKDSPEQPTFPLEGTVTIY